MGIVQQKNQEILDKQKLRIIEFLRAKRILGPMNTIWNIYFESKDGERGKQIDIVELFQEMMNTSDNYPFRDMLDKVRQFHNTFGIETQEEPYFPDPRVQIMRHNLLYEEMRETIASYSGGKESMNLTEGLDGLTDCLYILLGTFDTYGMQDIMVDAFLAVHDSNMTKLGEDGLPMYRPGDGKVIKGPNFRPPTEMLSHILLEVAKKHNDKKIENNE